MRRAKPGARVAGAAFSAIKEDSFAEERGGCHQESGDLRSGDRAIDRRVECAVPISPDHPITRSLDHPMRRRRGMKAKDFLAAMVAIIVAARLSGQTAAPPALAPLDSL